MNRGWGSRVQRGDVEARGKQKIQNVVARNSQGVAPCLRATALIQIVFLAVTAGVITGCGLEGKPPAGPIAPENAKVLRASPYAVKLSIKLHDETESNVLYIVDRDGILHWGGALDALVDKTSWSGPMSDDERRQLFDLLVQHGWFERDPISTNEPKKRVTRVEVSGEPGSNWFTVKGLCPDVQPVLDYLEPISRKRLGPQLLSLPQPGLQKR